MDQQSGYNCKNCNKPFSSKKKKVYCSRVCYFLSKNKTVEITCSICGIDFFVFYRFRNKKTCSAECTKRSISKTLTTKTNKSCLFCNTTFEVIKSCENKSKYCSSECFYRHRYNRNSKKIIKCCESCGKEFEKEFIKRNVRFCSKSCAVSGEKNPMYGKKSGMTGKKSWNNGLTSKNDDRVYRTGRKISETQKKLFESGVRSNKGEKNPMYGHTKDLLTPEQRERYSNAAIERVLRGVSGYKTGHLIGSYESKKADKIIRFKSSWELAAMMWWDRCESVFSYDYEPQIVELKDGRRSIPDFRVTYTDGTTKIFEIKPSSIQNLESVSEKLKLTKDSLHKSGMNYELLGDFEIKLMIKELGEDFKNEVQRHKNR